MKTSTRIIIGVAIAAVVAIVIYLVMNNKKKTSNVAASEQEEKEVITKEIVPISENQKFELSPTIAKQLNTALK